ncbi:hypothetical protein G6O69_26440 [Pseudenhygromyxa sp. WMMC2535]|uniref:hypothetical protein n=1 Tax=Pseudenhygromyxa sp. WMMC2535 TaxID=2712867 RepID=UPI001556ACB7|nr:hypothetical protein [Pseudenhygromyxa sp. WMMC2535]NVB41405.1 hypothetical protein [Pseudenhygromyxa sp. WMMC2535]
MSARPLALTLALSVSGVVALGAGCGDDRAAEAGAPPPAADADSDAPPDLPPVEDPIAAVPDCGALAERARHGDADLLLMPALCPGLPLDRGQLKTILVAEPSPAAIAAMIPTLDPHPELQGLARLAILDRASQPLPAELPDPATAQLTPIDDRVLAAVALAYAQLAATPEHGPAQGVDENQRTRAAAFLARVHLQALQSLGLPPGRPLPPFARLLAARVLDHGRAFCRFYWQRRVAGLERVFAEIELALLELSLDLDDTPHAGDSALLAVERQQTREYLERSGPTQRIAERARRRPEARGLDTALLLPMSQEVDRLFDQGFVAKAIDRAIEVGGASGGPGLDAVVALLTEDLRARELREYERALSRAAERARRRLPQSRREGSGELPPELPVEWLDAGTVAVDARAWLAIAHAHGPDFARRHALGRAFVLLRDRPDAVRELLDRGPEDPVITGERALLFALLDAADVDSLVALRLRVLHGHPAGSSSADADTRARRSYALATREALLHPR